MCNNVGLRQQHATSTGLGKAANSSSNQRAKKNIKRSVANVCTVCDAQVSTLREHPRAAHTYRSTWYQVLGTVVGTCYQVLGTWYQVLQDLVPSTWSPTPTRFIQLSILITPHGFKG